MNPLVNLDELVIEKTQNLYLLALDYTGIYVGTIEAILVLSNLSVHVATHTTNLLNFVATAGVLIIAMGDYYLQSKKLFDQYNLNVFKIRDMSIRKVLVLLLGWIPLIGNVVFLILGKFQITDLIYNLLFVSYIYINTALIRDREPKEWFPKRKLAHGDI